MTEITGGELLARALANEGVKFVFGLPCPEIDPFLAALSGNGIRFVPIRHESAGVHMAEGLFKTCGQVAVVLGNPGPGAANLLPGVVTARHEGVAVVAITSQHRPGVVYPSTPATFQGQDQLELFRPAVKWGAPVFEWARIPEIVRMAFREMWAGRPGPVHLEVPLTPLYATGDPASAPIYAKKRGRGSQPQMSAAQVGEAAALLAGARFPVIFAGCGVDRGQANAALLELAELLNCPVIPSMAGRGVIPHDHPLCFLSQSPAADTLRRQADVLLVIGSRLGNLDVPFDKYWGDPTRCHLIQIDIDPRHIGVSRPVALGILAEARSALEALTTALRGQTIASRGRTDLDDQRTAHTAWAKSLEEPIASWTGPGIHPGAAISRVGQAFGRDAVYCVDGGMTSLWSMMVLPSTRPSSLHGILELGMLGVGIPAAIGAKLADPSREVICVTGDGAAGFNIMELQTAVRERIKVTIIVMADGEWTMEVPNEMARWGKTFGTGMGDTRWDIVAQGLGAHGQYVEAISELDAALDAAKAQDGPALICIKSSMAANLKMHPSIGGRFFEVYFGPQP